MDVKRCDSCRNFKLIEDKECRGFCGIRKVFPLGIVDFDCEDWEAMEGYKRCNKCLDIIIMDGGFYKDKTKKYGYSSICKGCSSKRSREYYKNNKIYDKLCNRDKIKVDYKICARCDKEKESKHFNRDRKNRDGLFIYCKQCRKEERRKLSEDPEYIERDRAYKRKYYNKVKDNLEYKKKRSDQQKKYRQDGRYRERIREYDREYRKRPEYRKKRLEYQRKCRKLSHFQEKRKIYEERYKAKPKYRKRQREYNRKLRENPAYRLHKNISRGIHRSLIDGAKAGRKWEDLAGYTIDDLRLHLERQFKDSMTWSNYGKGGWEIDHVTPVSFFNFSKPEHLDFKKCWSLENLQPLWWYDNNKKSNKSDRPFQPSFDFVIDNNTMGVV